MSVQFGRWNFQGQPPAPDYIEKVSATLAPFGPDSNESYSKGGIRIIYRAFYTTKEARHEKQPCISTSGAVITWDGRVDNRAELISELRDSLNIASTDLAVVAAAYERWGTSCFARLIGDWALSIWNPNDRSLILAKDPIGTRHFYYTFDNNQVTWCTILDPLVLFAGRTFEICEEYIAGWFAIQFPAAHLTPYVGIQAVPPSSWVLLRPGIHGVKQVVCNYWDFDPYKKIRYHSDAEYEEHFRAVFSTAVRRRLRSDCPVLAELSGGLDSSSIVCMADVIIARGQAECPRLDTITWYDESKPNWGELPHFTKVEEKRGRIGHHIDFSSLKGYDSQKPFGTEFACDRFAATPNPNNERSEFFKRNAAYIKAGGYRVRLSGIGGEQPTGGSMPTPTPELQNLLARARFFALVRQLNAWAMKMRKPRPPLLWDAVRGFLPLLFQELPEYVNPAPPWLRSTFVRRCRAAFRGYQTRIKVFGPVPSLQEHLSMLDSERRVMAYFALESESLHEVRYPYHDRDLREFAYTIPREQLVRVGQRRSLMRRALVGIVPDELLNRKQKPFAPPEMKQVSAEWPTLTDLSWRMHSSSLGIIDPDRFCEALQQAQYKEEAAIRSLGRTLLLESWLRHLMAHGALTSLMATQTTKEPLVSGGQETPSVRRAHKFS